MTQENWQHGTDGVTAAGGDPFSELCGKIVLLITEDWFALSHFRPLIQVLTRIAHSVVVVTHSSGRFEEIEALGARVINFDFRRSSRNPAREAASAWALARILEAEAPDVVHLLAMKPIVLGGLALKLAPAPHVVVHVTGQGLMGITTSKLLRFYRAAALRLVGSLVRRPTSYVLVENPDDLAVLRQSGADPGPRFAILGGAGVDPQVFSPQPQPGNDVPVAAYVGRMIKSKGVDLLMDAYDRLLTRGVRLQLELCGKSDDGNMDAVDSGELRAWCQRSGARWFGHVTDVVDVWRRADFFVLPARGGEGMPRAMLEAAACARPLLVTNVPGSRHFVRDGVEGLVVPPEDVGALANALEQLANDRDLRARMGEAARLRLLHGFTEAQVKQTLFESYTSMLGQTRAS